MEGSNSWNARQHSVRGMPAVGATDCHDQRGHTTTNCDSDGDRYIDGCAYTHVYASSNRDAEPDADAYSNSSRERNNRMQRGFRGA